MKAIFLFNSFDFQKLNLPNLKKCGDCFLYSNSNLQELNLPNLQDYGNEINPIVFEYLTENKQKAKVKRL